MNRKRISFDDKKINKSTFYKNKKLFNIHDFDVNKILVSKKESYGTKNSLKYFIGYSDDDVIRSFLIMNLMKSLIINLLTINLKVKFVF